MRYLAIDYGSKRIGLAACDPSERFVSPLCQLPYNPQKPDHFFSELKEILRSYQIDEIVVGLPINMDDSLGPQAKLAQQFADGLSQQFTQPVHLFDERLSSMAADEMMEIGDFTKKNRKKRRDMLAACAILQEFLRHKNPAPPTDNLP